MLCPLASEIQHFACPKMRTKPLTQKSLNSASEYNCYHGDRIVQFVIVCAATFFWIAQYRPVLVMYMETLPVVNVHSTPSVSQITKCPFNEISKESLFLL